MKRFVTNSIRPLCCLAMRMERREVLNSYIMRIWWMLINYPGRAADQFNSFNPLAEGWARCTWDITKRQVWERMRGLLRGTEDESRERV